MMPIYVCSKIYIITRLSILQMTYRWFWLQAALRFLAPTGSSRQVYPEGNQSNNNQFLASATGTISAIDGLKVG